MPSLSKKPLYVQFFGDGADGDLTVTNGQTVTITATKYYRNLTVNSGGTLQVGNDNNQQWPQIFVAGTLTNDGTIRAGRPTKQTSASYIHGGGAAKATAGVGNAAGATVVQHIAAGRGGGGAAGGGDGTNAGGAGRWMLGASGGAGVWSFFDVTQGSQSTAGGTGLGANGLVADTLTSFFDFDSAPRFAGSPGYGAGGGACKVTGGSNAGGAGGSGGRGGGIIVICANVITNNASGVIHADGEVGGNGADGVASNVNGDISGGGGGAGGGGGGTVAILYRSLTNAGAIRANGGTGGTAGLGKQMTGGTPNQNLATSNGGAGGNGSPGIVAKTRVA